jgi:glutamyl-tRNA synthetase
MSVRVRFAPSPTGSLHLGSALTALLNVLYARHFGGKAVLRIDDTDEARNVPGAEAEIAADLAWLGLAFDEGPFRQSERVARHLEVAEAAEGAVRRDGAVWLEAPGVPAFVIVRSDGRPTYHWATAVDDVDLGITHVIRGNDHLSNTPLHEAAIRSLGATPPTYIHHALIQGDEGKLSKREGGFSVAGLREAGVPAEAVVSYLGLLGAAGPGAVTPLGEMAERFAPDRIPRGTIAFDERRLRSLSTAVLRMLPDAELVARTLPFAPPQAEATQVTTLAPALRGVHSLREAGDLVASVVEPPVPHPVPGLAEIRGRFPERLDEDEARGLVDELRREGLPLREVRLSLTGREHGPELWAVLAALPRDEAMRRAA